MNKQILLLLVFGLFWLGCEKESTSLIPDEDGISQIKSENSTNNEVTLRGNQPRPFKGTIEYNFITNSPLDCECPDGVTVELQGSGTISHLGLVSSPATYCMQIGTAGTCPVFGNTVIKECLYIIASNGDEVYLNVDTPYESCLEPECCWTGSIQGTFDGGTGRFTDASGEWTAEFFQYEGSPTSEVTVDGDIVY